MQLEITRMLGKRLWELFNVHCTTVCSHTSHVSYQCLLASVDHVATTKATKSFSANKQQEPWRRPCRPPHTRLPGSSLAMYYLSHKKCLYKQETFNITTKVISRLYLFVINLLLFHTEIVHSGVCTLKVFCKVLQHWTKSIDLSLASLDTELVTWWHNHNIAQALNWTLTEQSVLLFPGGRYNYKLVDTAGQRSQIAAGQTD